MIRSIMLKLILACSIGFVSTQTFAAADKAKAQAAGQKYIKEGESLLKKINSGKLEAAEAEKSLMLMFDEAQVVVTELAKADPKMTKLLQATLKLAPSMKSWDFDTVMNDIHDAKHKDFAKDKIGLDLTAEENGPALDPVHTMAHALMALAKIKSKDLKVGKEQIDEGIDQMKSALGMFK